MKISVHNGVGFRGFTLIEVVLAIVIGVGLFTGVLMFYQQAAVLREEILRKADALSAVRLVMDRVSTELRTVPPSTAGVSILSGDSRSLRILHTAVPSKAPWRGGNLGRASIVEADWVEVDHVRGAVKIHKIAADLEHRYHYMPQIHLDFYNESAMTWFILKYLNNTLVDQ